MSHRLFRIAAVMTGMLLAAVTPLFGQCLLEWQPGSPVSGVSGKVHSMVPAPGIGAVYAFGEFEVAGGVLASNAALWDGTSWSALGAGTNGVIYDALQMPNGDLVVAGDFTMAGGQTTANIARWDGATWSPLAQGLNDDVNELLLMPSGDVLAAGIFSQSGQTGVPRLGRWDGTSWSPFGASIGTSVVLTMELLSNGDLVIGGELYLPGAQSLPLIAVWDGTAWTLPPSAGGVVRDMQMLSNGDLAMLGTLPGISRFAIWDGASFQFESVPIALKPQEMALAANGDIYVVGFNLLGGVNVGPTVARRSNGAWTSEFAEPKDGLLSVAISNGQVFVGGTWFEQTSSVFTFDGGSWSALGGPSNTFITCMDGSANRTLYAGGGFDSIEGLPVDNVAFFDGTLWHAMGLGVDGDVSEIEVAANGNVVVAGAFSNAGGVPASGIARWNGISWSTVGGISMPSLHDLACGPSGQIAGVVTSTIYLFDGNAWMLPPPPNVIPGFNTIAVVDFLPNGDLVIAGVLNGANVQVWDGTSWTELGLTNEIGMVTDLVVTPTGDLYRAASNFFMNTVEQWDGTAWQQLGAAFSFPMLLQSLPSGELVIAGNLDPVANHVAFWDGSSWQTIDGGTSTGLVSDLAVTNSGELWMAGSMAAFGSNVSATYARAISSCPATATVFGSGCVGSNGPMTLEPLSNPWLGANLRSRATGFPSSGSPLSSLALHVLGTNPIVVPLPLGAPGCWQLVDPVLFELYVPNLGAVETSFAIPNLAVLVGQSFRTQVIGLELTAASALTRVTSTNALDVTIGSF